jgi:hypothetical protein
MGTERMAGQVGSELVVLAVLCAAVFFFLFPVAEGPYCVVYGPATTLSSIRGRLLLCLGMAMAAGQLLGVSMLTHRSAPRFSAVDNALRPLPVFPERTILRC